ncbi:hypothetical protein AB835_09690 [Candidatus Endobugula sertula]|uniref:Glycosyltransferase n=1 Tax=Candidatus Endobugula sertula TaxID=62101 RepID=A0A1D2QP30_9GAMM|nr:hypothetical protein AB835_09690 [Candidatus Endobugula sertula]
MVNSIPSLLFNHYRLLVMSKSPELGRVKTRMQPFLTQEQSVQLHIALSQYVLSQWQEAALCPIEIYVDGNIERYRELLLFARRLNDLPLYPQVEGDLGIKMSAAVKRTLLGDTVKGIVLVGTDCPFIDKVYLLQALSSLNNNHDIVIGPANDGGYVLLGMKQYYSELFTHISWGGEQVLAETLERIKALNVKYHILENLSDIDTMTDLKLLNQKYLPKKLRGFS